MDSFVRLTEALPTLAPEVRLLKAADYQAFLMARQILDEAQHQADAMRAEAECEYTRRHQIGYEEGLAQARMEMAVNLFETAERTVDYLGHIENKVAELVMTAVRKILGEFNDTELTLRVVRNALQVVRNQPYATIRIHPAQAASLQKRLQDLMAGYTSLGSVEIVADSRLDEGGCILETEIGVVDASLELQLRALEKVLRSRI